MPGLGLDSRSVISSSIIAIQQFSCQKNIWSSYGIPRATAMMTNIKGTSGNFHLRGAIVVESSATVAVCCEDLLRAKGKLRDCRWPTLRDGYQP